jgi:thioester reductase-like protein
MAAPHVRSIDGSDGVLLTGTTGFLGMELMARYLERSDRPVYALVRAHDESGAADRIRQSLFAFYGDDGGFPEGRLVPVPGDVESPGLGLAPEKREALADRVSEIVHSAASVSFELPLEDSRRINVEGTRQMLEFAELCRDRGTLRGFSYISTAYVAGTHKGEFREDQLEVGQGFRNPYERSKYEAERLVRDYGDRLPIHVFRPSIIVGESGTGWTASFNVLYAPLNAFARGLLPAVPARKGAPVDVVPVDYVADGVFELSRRRADGTQTHHLVAGTRAATVDELIDLAASKLGRRKPLVIPPALYRRLIHPVLLRRTDARGRRALERMEAFFPYLSARVRYRDERTQRLLKQRGVRMSPIERYFGRLLDFALRSRWGRRLVGRASALKVAERGGQVRDSRAA